MVEKQMKTFNVGDTRYIVTDAEAREDIAELQDAMSPLDVSAENGDVGKALKAKTVSGGKVTEYELGDAAIIDDTLSIAGEAADAKETGDAIAELDDAKVNKPATSPDGTSGQLLRTNGDGTTTWVDQGLPTDEQTADAVEAWLDAHPEATTTVQDGAITKAKLDSNLQNTVDDVADLKSHKVNKPSTSPNGTAGQILSTNGDGTTTWVDRALPTDEQVAKSVSNYLDDHPEATTTVEDGSLTEAKFSEMLSMQAINHYVTPQMFGALANGNNDDTDAVQAAITYSSNNGGGVYFPPGTYRIIQKITFGDLNVIEMDSKAIIRADANMEYMVEMRVGGYPTQRPNARNIRLDGNGKAQNGMYIRGISNAGCVCIAGLICENCIGNGVVFENCQGGLFKAIRSADHGGDGIQIIGCNNSKFISVSSLANGGNGILFSHGQTSASSGATYLYGIHAEQNEEYGIYFESGGLTTLYSGWLEGNKDTALYISANSKCNVYGLKVVHGDSAYWAEIYSDFATIRDCDVQVGSNTSFEPLVNADYCIIENLCRAVQSGVISTGGIIAEKTFANMMPHGDMQGTQSDYNWSCPGASTKEFQNTEQVDSGKTYSLKAISQSGGLTIRNADVLPGYVIGQLYKAVIRVYLHGFSNASVRFNVYNGTGSVYGNITNVDASMIDKWITFEDYFYATGTSLRVGWGTVSNGSAGDIAYFSEFFVSPVIPKRISNKRIGVNKTFESFDLTAF